MSEADPDGATFDHSWMCTYYDFYTPLRQLFTGIQVAGPRLTPTSIDRGFHAIPRIASTSPRVPACFYEPDDYTCVKDGVQMWWDSTFQRSSYPPSGCWRMTESGRRYFSDVWPGDDVGTQKRPNDPCNNYQAGNTRRATSS